MARKKSLPEEQVENAADVVLEVAETSADEAFEAASDTPLLLADAEPSLETEDESQGVPSAETEEGESSDIVENQDASASKRRRTKKEDPPAEPESSAAESETAFDEATALPDEEVVEPDDPDPEPSEDDASDDTELEEQAEPSPRRRTRARRSILTLEAGEHIQSPEEQDEIAWHELQNGYRTKRILTGILSGVEQTSGKNNICIVYYKNLRVTIPYSEMMIQIPDEAQFNYGSLVERQDKIINNMLGAEIDFIIRGMDNEARAVVASRRSAMIKKRERYYLRTDPVTGLAQVHAGRIAQARVIALNPVTVRVDIFGVETSIRATDMSWDWIGNVTEKYHVGDHILVRVLDVEGDSPDTLVVHADAKSVYPNTTKENLLKCNVQGKYVGTVTNINKGAVYLQLANGVNAVAHSCFDSRTPGRKDVVGFVVTRIDTTHNLAVGLITRIIKQNI